MREAHAHLYSLGQSLGIPSLATCTSKDECLDAASAAVAAAQRADPASPFARLHSARISAWTDGAWPSLADLDRATGNVPCVILSFDHHAALANSAAMSLAGLRAGTPVPPNGVVVSSSGGVATGVLLEDAAFAAWNAAPEPTESARTNLVAAGLAGLRALGYAEVHDLHSQPWLGQVLAGLERDGRLAMAVWMYPNVRDLQAVAAERGAFESARVRLAGAKLFADGTLSSRTALLMHRYCEPLPDMPRGKAMVPPAQIDEQLRRADAVGLPLAVHAIGDCAVKMVLDCHERVKPRARGQRIEHCELVDRADVPRFVKLGITCSVQPCHLLADARTLKRYVSHRLDRVLPLRELIDSGLRPGKIGKDGHGPGLVFGSDVPIVRADAADSIQAAVHRRAAGESPSDAIAPEQAISEAEAWACFGVS